MSFLFAAALTQAAAAPLSAPTPTPAAPPDFTYAIPISGNWTYAPAPDGSAATFVNASAMPQLTVRCVRATRRISLSKPASVAVPFLSVWTSTMTRSVPASFDPATARQTIQIPAYDPLLDALAFSRGRIAVYIPDKPALVVPAWPEVARVVEDCRY